MSYQNISVTNKLFRVRESTLWLHRVVTASLIYQVTDKLPGKCDFRSRPCVLRYLWAVLCRSESVACLPDFVTSITFFPLTANEQRNHPSHLSSLETSITRSR